jgi:hypothetical protein
MIFTAAIGSRSLDAAVGGDPGPRTLHADRPRDVVEGQKAIARLRAIASAPVQLRTLWLTKLLDPQSQKHGTPGLAGPVPIRLGRHVERGLTPRRHNTSHSVECRLDVRHESALSEWPRYGGTSLESP